MSRAFRTNIVRRILAFALVALAFDFACTTSAPAQSNKDAERMQKVGRDINRIGIGEKVWVKTLDGAKLKGHINENRRGLRGGGGQQDGRCYETPVRSGETGQDCRGEVVFGPGRVARNYFAACDHRRGNPG